MRLLPKPTQSAKSTFELCAESIRDQELKKRLTSVSSHVEAADLEYGQKGDISSLFSIRTQTSISGIVTTREMETIYKGTFSRKGSRPRRIYDQLKLAPRNGICPLCGQRVVSTLDHYLAKSMHPALAVTPLNLVPACGDCNKAKLDRQPSCMEDQTLHPYFDQVDDGIWLIAIVVEENPPAIVFNATPPADWLESKRERVIRHFKVFQLGQLYSAHAAEELAGMRHSFLLVADRGGSDGLREFISEQATSRSLVVTNSWQRALYESLHQSDWFCDEGYRLIPS